jgi:hypothetical protein
MDCNHEQAFWTLQRAFNYLMSTKADARALRIIVDGQREVLNTANRRQFTQPAMGEMINARNMAVSLL